MKTIPLTQGKVAIVDDCDYEKFNQWKWYANKQRNHWYVVRGIQFNKKMTIIRMHREILGLKFGDGIISDHKNGNGLDNQRHNLRKCNNAQNQYNKKPKPHSSKFKGVSWYENTKKWQARIWCEGIYIFLGYFNSEIEAAKAYDKAAKKYHGEFAYLNFPEKFPQL